MSYERIQDKIESAVCACGKGKVIRHYYFDMNDWNQIRDGYYGEEIQCNECKKKYHIESISKSYTCPKWEGDGVVTTYYLVPNGKSLYRTHNYETPFGHQFSDSCVSDYKIEILESVVKDMVDNKYSTRLTQDASIEIFNRYYSLYKKKRLKPIISILQNCIDNYNSYEWTYDKAQAYKKKMQQVIETEDETIRKTFSESYTLNFE